MSGEAAKAYRTAFLLGSGINQRSWEPVIRAINRAAPDFHVTDAETANSYFALHVLHRKLVMLRARRAPEDTEAQRLLQAAEADDEALKRAIAEELRDARLRGDLRIRESLLGVLREPRFEGSCLLMTTNWDRCLEALLHRHGHVATNVFHLHGDESEPRTMLLPSEVTGEDYRSADDQPAMDARRGGLWRWLARAEQVCIFGLSLSPLDAELTLAISVGLRERAQQGSPATVILYACARDIRVVEQRLRMQLGRDTHITLETHPQACGECPHCGGSGFAA